MDRGDDGAVGEAGLMNKFKGVAYVALLWCPVNATFSHLSMAP